MLLNLYVLISVLFLIFSIVYAAFNRKDKGIYITISLIVFNIWFYGFSDLLPFETLDGPKPLLFVLIYVSGFMLIVILANAFSKNKTFFIIKSKWGVFLLVFLVLYLLSSFLVFQKYASM